MRRAAIVLLVAASWALPARAFSDNDLQLYRLGHPDDIVVCTKCDGSDRTKEKGDPAAQARFARLSSTLGLAFVPPFQESAGTTGQSGFELGFSGSEAFLRIAPDEWATFGSQATSSPPPVLFIPTIVLRKGLGGSLELGASVAWLTGSQMLAMTGELRFGLIDGVAYAPDLALRAYATRVVGSQELDLTLGGADLQLAKSFGLGGMVKLQPYGQYGMAFVNAASGVVNFRPALADPTDPTAADGVFHTLSFFQNRFHRVSLGLRLVAGAVVLGLEGSVALGQNPIQQDALAGGAPTPTQFTARTPSSRTLSQAARRRQPSSRGWSAPRPGSASPSRGQPLERKRRRTARAGAPGRS